jgi:Domain of unknown function (DUF4136)
MRLQSIDLVLALAAGASLLALGGCASQPDVRVDFDRSAEFAQYKTFAFVSPLGTDRSGYQTIVSQNLKNATQREMEARGMRLDITAPQLLVNFNATLSEQYRVTSMPWPSVGVGYGRGYYGYRYGMYGAWPYYADPTMVYQYTEGTLNIDVVDAARRQLVWEGVVTKSVTDQDRQDVKAAIDAAVAAAFAKYPIPGPGAPK